MYLVYLEDFELWLGRVVEEEAGSCRDFEWNILLIILGLGALGLQGKVLGLQGFRALVRALGF